MVHSQIPYFLLLSTCLFIFFGALGTRVTLDFSVAAIHPSLSFASLWASAIRISLGEFQSLMFVQTGKLLFFECSLLHKPLVIVWVDSLQECCSFENLFKFLVSKALDSQTCSWVENSFDAALAEELLEKECILQGNVNNIQLFLLFCISVSL